MVDEIQTKFTVNHGELEYIKEKVEKLNRRAAKIGCAPITLTILKEYQQEVPQDNGQVALQDVADIELVGEAPKINGWEFAATLEPVDTETDDEKNIINRMPGFSGDIPVEYRSASMLRCDHCHTERRRNETFVIRHIESGEYKVVGRQCIKDFMGYHASPMGLVRMAKDWDNLLSEIHSGLGGGHYTFTANLKEFLFRAAYFVKKHGYVRSGEFDEYGMTKTPTKYATWETIWIPGKYKQEDPYYGFFYHCDGTTPGNFGMTKATTKQKTMTEEDYKEVKEYMEGAIKYICEVVGGNEDDLNDYLYNLRTIMQMHRIELKHAGYAASIYAVYEKHLGKERERKMREKSEWQGEVGKKITMPDVKLVNARGFDSQYGWSEILTFSDKQGNYYKWFTNTRAKLNLNVGDVVAMVATVKKHELYKDAKSTVVTHAKVTKIEEGV